MTAPQATRKAGPPLIVPAQVDDLGLSAPAFRVYAHLCRRASGSGKCWPASPSIIKTCRLNKRTVWRSLDELETAGLVKRERGPRNSNVYTIVSLQEVGTYSAPTESVESVQKEGLQQVQNEPRQQVHSESRQSVQKEGRKGVPMKEYQRREPEGGGDSPLSVLPVRLGDQEYQKAADQLKVTEPQARGFYSTFRLRKQPFIGKDYPSLTRAEVPDVFVVWMGSNGGKELMAQLRRSTPRTYDRI